MQFATISKSKTLPPFLDVLLFVALGFLCTFSSTYLLLNRTGPVTFAAARARYSASVHEWIQAPVLLASTDAAKLKLGGRPLMHPMSRLPMSPTTRSSAPATRRDATGFLFFDDLSMGNRTASGSSTRPSIQITHTTSSRPLTRVAIVVPFRNRASQLAEFIPIMKTYLSKHNIIYKIFIIEQLGRAKFNRGALLNIGFLEANSGVTSEDRFDCMTIHDIDLIPQVDANTYDCLKPPVQKAWQLSSAIDVFGWDTPPMADGGVNLLQSHIYRDANGFSNRFYGWGGEDNDLKTRLGAIQASFVKRPKPLGRYASLKKGNYKSGQTADNRFGLLDHSYQLRFEGLTTIRYRVISRHVSSDYTTISIDIFFSEEPDIGIRF